MTSRWTTHDHHEGRLSAWRDLNQRVADDLASGQGDIVPIGTTRRRWKVPDPKRHIGWFARRVLRGEFRARKDGS